MAETGEPLPTAHVVLLGAERGVVADSLGRFRIDDVPAGPHRIRASFVGYEPETQEVKVAEGQTLIVRFELEFFGLAYHPPIVVEVDRLRSIGRTREFPHVVPRAVALLTARQLDAQGVRDVEGALRNVSGVVVESRAQPVATFTLRGLPTDPTGTFRRNGIEYPHLYGGLRPNVIAVEVLKGPASVLYGRLEPGGVVNFVTRRPYCGSPVRRLEVAASTFGAVAGAGVYESDCVFWRDPTFVVDVAAERRPSFREQVTEETAFISGAGRVVPGDGPIQIDMDAEYEVAGAVLDPGLVSVDGAVSDGLDRRPFFGEPRARYRWQNAFASVTGEWSPGIHGRDRQGVRTITSRLAYGRYRHGRDWVTLDSLTADGMIARSLRVDDTRYRYLYAELSTDGELRLGPVRNAFVAGLEATRLAIDVTGEAPLRSTNGGFRFAAIDPISLLDPQPTGLPGEGDLIEYVRASGSGWNMGVFVQNRVEIPTPLGRLHAVGSARLSRVTAGAEWFALATTPETPAGLNERHVTLTALTPAFALLLEPSPWLSLYGSYGTSFNPVFNQVDAEGRPFEPTRGEQFEVGLKVEHRRFTATLAAFDIEKRGALSLSPAGHYVQTGAQRSRGVELDFSGSPVRRLTVLGAFTLLDARVTTDDVIPVGNSLPAAPAHSARLWVSYDVLDVGPFLTVALGGHYVGERYGTLENDLLLPAYGVLDASVTLTTTGGLEVQVSAENLLDRRYLIAGERRGSGPGVLVVGWPGAPRSVMARVRVDVHQLALGLGGG